ncbi:winged helix-turn-helix domain-containing protein [Arthrobacter sp. H20]|uniref:helix-turn-helix transcriptional regulator n=1 Tax=Arthrobacter sp. H20 TaxID=1267981 RepID=UPI0009E056FC|nr:winged helix-turn-helix domain-containing protein [Arthrobacter sp. H20]
MADWTFLTNHTHVLMCVANDPGMRFRDIAVAVGITERAAQRIVAELVAAGYLQRQRDGRRNRYQLYPELPLRHPLERHHQIGELLEVLEADPRSPASPPRSERIVGRTPDTNGA